MVSSFLQKVSRETVEVGGSGIEDLSTAAARQEMSRCFQFCAGARKRNRIGQSLERLSRKEFPEFAPVLNHGRFKDSRFGIRRMTVTKGVASQLMSLLQKNRQIIRQEYFADRRRLAHETECRVIRPRNPEIAKNGAPGVKRGAREVIEGE